MGCFALLKIRSEICGDEFGSYAQRRDGLSIELFTPVRQRVTYGSLYPLRCSCTTTLVDKNDRKLLFTDAKAGKNAPKQIIGSERTGDFPKRLMCAT